MSSLSPRSSITGSSEIRDPGLSEIGQAGRETLANLMAILANLDAVDASGEPNTISIEELREIGTLALNIVQPLGQEG